MNFHDELRSAYSYCSTVSYIISHVTKDLVDNEVLIIAIKIEGTKLNPSRQYKPFEFTIYQNESGYPDFTCSTYSADLF